jgi:hypothetical protein
MKRSWIVVLVVTVACEIRGDGWGSRTGLSGCPSAGDEAR